MTMTPSGKLPKLDLARIEQDARRDVHDLTKFSRSPVSRLKTAAGIVNNAVDEMQPLRGPRDAAALSLSLHDGVRAVHDVIGVSRAYFHAMRCKALQLSEAERGTWLKNADRDRVAGRAVEMGVPRVEDAATIVVDLGRRVADLDARAAAARVVRDAAIRELAGPPHNWSRRQIAEVAGFDDSRVSQILGEQG